MPDITRGNDKGKRRYVKFNIAINFWLLSISVHLESLYVIRYRGLSNEKWSLLKVTVKTIDTEEYERAFNSRKEVLAGVKGGIGSFK
ncbi:hypothetical protein PUN28_006328 [Cardiocondyla obscurior]|uniref:Uncharacterized protein n=1 Tax=Cardiocondyla obscurior TaxID=286306 RepID=A0AAW2GB29_9HYME